MTGKLLRASLKTLASLVEAGYVEVADGQARIVPALLARKHGFRAKTLKRYLDELVSAGLAEKKIEKISGIEYSVYLVDVERALKLAETLSATPSKPLPLVDAESLASTLTEKLAGKLAESLRNIIVEKLEREIREAVESAVRQTSKTLSVESIEKLEKKLKNIEKKLQATMKEKKQLEKQLEEALERVRELEEENKRLREELERRRLGIPVSAAPRSLLEKLRVVLERNAELEREVEELKAKLRQLEREKRRLEALVK